MILNTKWYVLKGDFMGLLGGTIIYIFSLIVSFVLFVKFNELWQRTSKKFFLSLSETCALLLCALLGCSYVIAFLWIVQGILWIQSLFL